MMDFLRKYQYHVFMFTMVVFLAGVFLGFGNVFLGKGGPNDSVAEVDGVSVTVSHFMNHYNRVLNNIPPGTKVDDALRQQKREETMRDLIQGVVFDRQAKHYHISVPDQQVIGSLMSVPAFQTKGSFDPQLYQRALNQLQMTPAEFEEEQRNSIAFNKLRWLIQSAVRITDNEAQMLWAFQHKGSLNGFEKEQSSFREKIWQEKVLFCFNQWFSQIGQRTHVKTHMDVLQGVNG